MAFDYLSSLTCFLATPWRTGFLTAEGGIPDESY
jgi:hypothetical protein